MRKSPSPRFGLILALVSTVVILYISFVTLGQGHQSRVETRLPGIIELANGSGVPLPALMALCVAESYRDPMRPDPDLVLLLAAALQEEKGDVQEAIRRLYPDPVQCNLVIDLLAMNKNRWTRLAAQFQDS